MAAVDRPADITVEFVSGTTVRLLNDTDTTWVARAADWEDLECVGYMSAEPAVRRDGWRATT